MSPKLTYNNIIMKKQLHNYILNCYDETVTNML